MRRRWLNGGRIGILAALVSVAVAAVVYVRWAPDQWRLSAVNHDLGEETEGLVCMARYIVITPDALEWMHGQGPANRALLISDPGEVCRIERLSRGKKSDLSSCAYHWRISYWDSATEFDVVPFNQECSEFGPNTKEVHRLLRPHFARLRKSLPHHLYDVDVPAFSVPKRIARDLARLGTVPLFWFGTEAHHPVVVLKVRHKSPEPSLDAPMENTRNENERSCRLRLTQLLTGLKQRYPVTKEGMVMHEFSLGTMEGSVRVVLRFAPPVDVEKVLAYLRSRNVEVISYQPLLDLRLVVVDTEVDLNKVRRKLRSVLPSLRNVTRHPGLMPMQRNFIEGRKVAR